MQQKNEKNLNHSVLHVQAFSIINRASGANWFLLLRLFDQQQQSNSREEGTFFFCVWDLVGQPVERYQLFYNQLLKAWKKSKIKVIQDFRFPIQSSHERTCGLYCLYIAHYLIKKIEQKSVSFFKFDSFILPVFQPLKIEQELHLVLFCNKYCNTNLLYQIFEHSRPKCVESK